MAKTGGSTRGSTRGSRPGEPDGGGGARGPLVKLLAVATVLGLVVALLFLTLVNRGSGDDDALPSGPPQGSNPFTDRAPYSWPDSPAAKAVASLPEADAALMRRLAGTPTAVWLTPEAHPTSQVGGFVSGIVAKARAERRTPVFVVYGIPDRDCSGGLSSGGLDVTGYQTWVREIARAAGRWSAVVLEPDALASAPECGLVAEREQLIATAVAALSDGPTTYVDAGHSDWVAPATMADMLRAVGADHVRGFSVNVSGYGADQDELAYAEQVRGALGAGSYVIDSSRNGVGPGDTWCNPAGRAVGHAPEAGPSGGGLDAYLWIKPPGESDGTCNGGPPAGQFWPQRALEMARAAGW